MTRIAAAVRGRVIVVSDRVAGGAREDQSGPALASAMTASNVVVDTIIVVPDESEDVARAVRVAAGERIDIICTTGGTGFGPRDRTPEATRSVLEREAPGIAEALRRASDRDGLGFGLRSRGVAGVIGTSIVVNLPGSTSGAVEGWAVIADHIPHLVAVLAGEDPH